MTRRSGFTLIELLLALSLFSILVIALVRLLDTSLTIWDRTEVNREITEMGMSLAELIVDDVEATEGGPRGDLLGEWVAFDTNNDTFHDAVWPRLRLVRQAGAAELLRLDPTADLQPHELGLIEVCWALLPSGSKHPDHRNVGVLFRGERRIDDEQTLSFFDEKFFSSSHMPVPGSMSQVTGGVLWFSIVYASQTSILRDGWKVGSDLKDCATSWDAWGRDRPDLELTELNEPAAGSPEARDLPVLPRRIRAYIELERPAEVRRRTRIDEALEPDTVMFHVRDDRRLPDVGTHIRLGEEWMQILGRRGTQLTVKRAQRGTRARPHDSGTLVHFGAPLLREITVYAYREDWDL